MHPPLGSRIASRRCRERLTEAGLLCPTSRAGIASDNVHAPSFRKTLTHEEIFPRSYCTMDSGASSVRVTRLPDGSDATGAIVRRWRIESQGNHVAACLTPTVSDRYVDSGKRYYLPFAATLTQVRYTGETYP